MDITHITDPAIPPIAASDGQGWPNAAVAMECGSDERVWAEIVQDLWRPSGQFQRVETPADVSEDFSDDGCLRDESDDTHRLAAKEQERIDLVDAANQPGPRFPAGRSFTGRVPPSAPYWTGSIGAVGKGRWPAVPAIAGMVAGAALSAEHYPFFKTTVLAWKVFGKIGLPEALGVSPWIIIPIFRAGTILQFCRFEKKGV